MPASRQSSMTSQATPPPNEKTLAVEELATSPTAGLSSEEKEIIERQTASPQLKIGYFSLFRYANKKEALIMVVATIASIAAGAVMPLMTVSGLTW